MHIAKINKLQSEYFELIERYYKDDYAKISSKINVGHPNRYQGFYEGIINHYEHKVSLLSGGDSRFTFAQIKTEEFLVEVNHFWGLNRDNQRESIKLIEDYKLIEGNCGIDYIVQSTLNKFLYFSSICVIDGFQVFAESVLYDRNCLLNHTSLVKNLFDACIVLDNPELFLPQGGKPPCIIMIPPLFSRFSEQLDEFLKTPKKELNIFLDSLGHKYGGRCSEQEVIEAARKDLCLGPVIFKVDLETLPRNGTTVEKLKNYYRHVTYGGGISGASVIDMLWYCLAEEFVLTYEMQLLSIMYNLDYGLNRSTFPNILAINQYNLDELFKSAAYNEELQVASFFESKNRHELVSIIDKTTLIELRNSDTTEELQDLFTFNRKILKSSSLENFFATQKEINENISEALDRHSSELASKHLRKKIYKSSVITTINVGLAVSAFALPQISPLALASLALTVIGRGSGIVDLIDDINAGKKEFDNVSSRAIGILLKNRT